MPGKLIAFIVTLLIIVTFIGFNIENSSDIRVWFGEGGLLKDVPIFVSFFIMYLIGVLSVIPFIMSWRLRKDRAARKAEDEETARAEESPRKVRVLGARKKKAVESPDEDTKENGNAGESEPEDDGTEGDSASD